METAAVAMASAEATERMPMAVREELHPTDRAVRPTATDRPTDSAEATATTATTEAREGHPMAVLPLVRVARHTGTGRLTDSAEAMATTPKVERREDHPTDRAVLHSARVVHPTDREEVTAAARKAAREGRHIQGNRPAATDSALSREVSQPAEAPATRVRRSSDARTSRISPRLTRPESTRCFQGSHRLTRLFPTTTTFLHLSRKRYV